MKDKGLGGDDGAGGHERGERGSGGERTWRERTVRGQSLGPIDGARHPSEHDEEGGTHEHGKKPLKPNHGRVTPDRDAAT